MKSKAQTRPSIKELTLNFDCDICGKPINDGADVAAILLGNFYRVNMHMESKVAIFTHRECLDNLGTLIGKESVTP